MYISYGVEQCVWVVDASSWPGWHKQLVASLEQSTSWQNLSHNLDIASLIEEAKQEYVDQYCTISKLVQLYLYRILQLDYKYDDYLTTV